MYPIYNGLAKRDNNTKLFLPVDSNPSVNNFVIIGGGGNTIDNNVTEPSNIIKSSFDSVFDKTTISAIDNNATCYANGYYLSSNNNKISSENTVKCVVFNDRYIGPSAGLNIAPLYDTVEYAGLLISNYTISMWLYPILDNISTMSVLTKGSNLNAGELTILIGTDNRIYIFWYNNINGTSYIKSNVIMASRRKYFITLINNGFNMILYVDNVLDNQTTLGTILPSVSNNNIILGNSYTSAILLNKLVPFNGTIENFLIQNSAITNLEVYYKQFYRAPDTIFYIFNTGKITFDSQTGQTENPSGLNYIDRCKNIVKRLAQYINGFIIMPDSNVLFYINLEGISGEGLSRYHHITTFSPSPDTIFIQSSVNYQFQTNLLVEDPVQLNGYVKSNNGMYQYFYNGRVLLYSPGSQYTFPNGEIINNYIVRQNMTVIDALNIMSEFYKVLCYTFNGTDYIFYSKYGNLVHNNDFTNTFCLKFISYSMGSINSDLKCFGTQNIGYYTFNTPSIYNLNTIEKALINTDNNISHSKAVLQLPPPREINVNSVVPDSAIYIYNTRNINVSGILDEIRDIYISEIPHLENVLSVTLNTDDPVDLIDYLVANSISLNRQIICNYRLLLPPAMYNLCVTTNTYVTIKLGDKTYKINSVGMKNILFHHSRNYVDLEISFYYHSSTTKLNYLLSSP
jgi:hypothetical protein